MNASGSDHSDDNDDYHFPPRRRADDAWLCIHDELEKKDTLPARMPLYFFSSQGTAISMTRKNSVMTVMERSWLAFMLLRMRRMEWKVVGCCLWS